MIQDRIRDAIVVEEGEDPDDPAKRLELANAVSAAADLSQAMGQAEQTESHLYWMVRLCQEQVDREVPRHQFLVPLSTACHNLGLVQWQLGRPRDAETSFESAIAQLTRLRNLSVWAPQLGIALVGCVVDIAILQIEEARHSELSSRLNEPSQRQRVSSEDHPRSRECGAESASAGKLARQFQGGRKLPAGSRARPGAIFTWLRALLARHRRHQWTLPLDNRRCPKAGTTSRPGHPSRRLPSRSTLSSAR